MWLFGGQGYDGTGWLDQSQYHYEDYSTAYFSLNDLWRWDGTNWTWVSGSNVPNQTGTYGTKGVPAPTNVPGARHGSVSWADGNGNLWLFGGEGEGYRNDLWKWDGTNWTWVSGSDASGQTGTYGTKGVPAPENVPGARVDATSWTDGNGNLWLFGGRGTGLEVGGNDLWKWDGTNWTWMSGATSALQEGVYGTKGVPAPGNVPGARFGSVSWTDSVGNLWLFGGSGYSRGGYGSFNDLWRWDGTNWTWMSGANVVGDPGSYGTKGVAAPTNVPRARAGAVTWTDAAGSLWLFGGAKESWYGGPPSYNDLWKWDGTNWTWVSGSAGPNQSGSYGAKGVGAPGNVPGARFESIPWTDPSGNLWLFGGDGFDSVGVPGSLNDLWVFGTTCAAVAPPTAGNLGPFPTGWTIRLTASTVEGATYLWTGPNGFTSAVQNPTIPNATMAKAGDYSVSLIVGGCSSGTSTTTVVVVPGTGQSLSVSKDGAGAGTVSSQPAGIDCGDVCSEGFPGGSQVTLTATPAAGSRFAGWVGEGCFGIGPCTLTMDATRHVSASFLSSAGTRFFPLAPCRVVDTRSGRCLLESPL
ncbi:MAG: hypothetical protein IPP07_19400 [Holophagales bacterium]|nr:hypothetical protein [Holophagales bacterium]